MIKNRQNLEISQLRKHMLSVVEAGLRPAAIDAIAQNTISYSVRTRILKILSSSFNLNNFSRVALIGAANDPAFREVQSLLAAETPEVLYIEGGPWRAFSKQDLAIAVVSSAWNNYFLFSLPAREKLILAALEKTPATPQEINLVLSHSQTSLKHLAENVYPSMFIGLNFSLDPGLSPTVKALGTSYDAANILNKYNILDSVNLSSVRLKQAPSEQRYFARAQNFNLMDGKEVVKGLRDQAENLGYSFVYGNNQQEIQDKLQAMPAYSCLYLDNYPKPENLAKHFGNNAIIFAAEPGQQRLGLMWDEFSLKKDQSFGLRAENAIPIGQLNGEEVLFTRNNVIDGLKFTVVMKN